MHLMEQTKRFVRRLANELGFEITRFNCKGSERAKLARFLSSNRVNLVLDVGANIGQYAKQLRDLGYRGRIVSFEPVSTAHLLLKKAAGRDRDWVVAPRTAIGNKDGIASINVAANSVFSSLLPGDEILGHIDSTSMIAHEEQVQMMTLNSLAPRYLHREDVSFLKIDVQGFEYEVLRGAAEMLEAICGIQLELSLIPLYQGEKSFRFMLDFMESLGFDLHSLASVFADESTGREIQLDAIFVRNG